MFQKIKSSYSSDSKNTEDCPFGKRIVNLTGNDFALCLL